MCDLGGVMRNLLIVTGAAVVAGTALFAQGQGTRMGLDKTGRIGRVVIDPVNPQVVLACALGTAYGPQQERGIFRTTDGGATWQRTLFTDENTGCSEIASDPSNPRILFAGMWQL